MGHQRMVSDIPIASFTADPAWTSHRKDGVDLGFFVTRRLNC